MIGERDNAYTDSDYGTLHMRPYKIEGNDINAFYDSSDNLVFVLDNTINANKSNVLLVMNPDADRKWDEILSDDYDVDLETIRPKQDNKYQKLDIEYSGLNVYEKLINAYKAGDSLNEELNQLNVLRDSAARHSAMTRLTVANETISKTNATIVKTKETIVRLQERIKTLRAKLSATKKEIGRVPTKQSASRVLKLESQIDATNEKLKRAKKRLESAQKRLEVATVDAELASELLNQPATEIKEKPKASEKNKPVAVVPEYKVQKAEPEFDEDDEEDFEDEIADEDINEEFEDNGVKPLFNNDPKILNEDIAFKPISFETPVVSSGADEEKPDVKVEDVVPDVPMIENSEPVKEKMSQLSEIMIPEIKEPETVPELPATEQVAQIPLLDDTFDAPETAVPESEPVKDEIKEKPVLESLSPISNIPEALPEYENVWAEQKTEENNNSVLDSMTPIVRQSEPEVVEESEAVIESESTNKEPVDEKLIAPMTESMHDEFIGESDKHKPTIIYYGLLIILIALSVFTLWLYQKNTMNTTPVLTSDIEKTNVLKKTDKPKKVVEPVVTGDSVDTEAVFLDEIQPNENTAKPADDVTEQNDIVSDDVVNQSVEPVVLDAVPARVTSSGELDDPEQRKIASEEEILAKKPTYEPGAKYDEMFVVENPDAMTDEVVDVQSENTDYEEYEPVDDSVINENNNEDMVFIDEANPFYDEEEAQYQAEQQEMYYEE